jgi:hypothetical protein
MFCIEETVLFRIITITILLHKIKIVAAVYKEISFCDSAPPGPQYSNPVMFRMLWPTCCNFGPLPLHKIEI